MGKLRNKRRRRPSKTITGLNRSSTAAKVAGQTAGFNNPVVGEIGQGEIITVVLETSGTPVVTPLQARRTAAILVEADPYGGGDIPETTAAVPSAIAWTLRGDNLLAWSNTVPITLGFLVY